MPWPWSSVPPNPPPQPKTTSPVDRRELLTWTADGIGARLRKGTLSVKDVVEATIQRVNEDNKDGLKLAAIIYLAPRSKLLERAKQLDKELEASQPRGSLHGIPVVIKVCISEVAVNCLVELLIDNCWSGLLCHPSGSGNEYQCRKPCIIERHSYQKRSYR